MNIMDGMDAARFTSGNPDIKKKRLQARKDRRVMPAMVLRNFNNK